ncbi:MAG: ParB/RepB/Spo0J family partition protein [Blastomonas fulva]|uniref:ParB/RepB/Spo0J family partition protein n=1 Tax=Blastomonas fulva TaxID=1550728 RepID=UPI0024E20107|nr:ParB/RepB/Spo0J family partition protein [Blastomonas fulva]MDK2757522.1 ParB/RepB/Spo0J family partition protein [Blastomonas fulva]
MNQTIPLNKLILSPRNVRRTNGDEDIESLADSIHSKGLLQNLVVSESVEHPGKHEVDAGGRRWRALNLLVDQKRIAKTFPVPVHIIPRDDALEASLVENLEKVAMNPADEVEAFHAIVHGGEPSIDDVPNRIANCARRFGRTVRYVEQRLRLAALAPQILTALREYRISIEAARAYASHPGHAEQLVVFRKEEAKAQNQPEWSHRPVSIREALAGKSFPLDHRLVRYVGLDAYIAAGGQTERDLFFGDDDREILIDTALVKRLASAKALAQAEYQANRAGWGGAALCPVDGPHWGTPKAPDGFVSTWTPDVSKIPLIEKIDAIAIYRLNSEGDAVELVETQWMKPVAPAEPGKADASSPAIGRDWAAERRAKEIRVVAARLAAEPSLKDTPLKGRAFWPMENVQWIEPISESDDGKVFVALWVQVDPADIEANLAEAEQSYDADRAAELAENAAADEAARVEEPVS